MKITFWPFCSQQDKYSKLFRLSSDSIVKAYSYMANKSLELGWTPCMVLPHKVQRADSAPISARVMDLTPSEPIELDNRLRRLQWLPSFAEAVAKGSDVVVTQHEHMAVPLRVLNSKLKIVTEHGGNDGAWPCRPTYELFRLAWGCSDLVHCSCQELADQVPGEVATSVWEFAYEDSLRTFGNHGDRCYDVMFNARASATGYTNHKLFYAAVHGMPYWLYVPDPTNYLRSTPGEFQLGVPARAPGRSEYIGALVNSKVVCCLSRNVYGGFALREAVACGCCPVVLRSPAIDRFLTPDWPYSIDWCDNHDTLALRVRDALQRAVKEGWHSVDKATREHIAEQLRLCTYSAAWEVARKDLEALR